MQLGLCTLKPGLLVEELKKQNKKTNRDSSKAQTKTPDKPQAEY